MGPLPAAALQQKGHSVLGVRAGWRLQKNWRPRPRRQRQAGGLAASGGGIHAAAPHGSQCPSAARHRQLAGSGTAQKTHSMPARGQPRSLTLCPRASSTRMQQTKRWASWACDCGTSQPTLPPTLVLKPSQARIDKLSTERITDRCSPACCAVLLAWRRSLAGHVARLPLLLEIDSNQSYTAAACQKSSQRPPTIKVADTAPQHAQSWERTALASGELGVAHQGRWLPARQPQQASPWASPAL